MADDLRTKEIQSRLKFFHQIGFRRLNVMNNLDIRRALQNALLTHAGYTVEAVLSDLVTSCQVPSGWMDPRAVRILESEKLLKEKMGC